jgi:hypothetical protein
MSDETAQIIAKQQSFEPAAQVAAGAVAAIANSSQWPVIQRISVLDHLEQIIVNTRDTLQPSYPVSGASTPAQVQSPPVSAQNSPLRPRPVGNYYKCTVFGAKDTGKSTWINQAKMQIESFSSSTPATLFSKDIIYRPAIGSQIHFSMWEVSSSLSFEEQEVLKSGSHVIFILYDSSNESSVLYADQLVRNWTQLQQSLPLLILVDNRPPSGEGKHEPQIKSAEHIIISTAKRGNITAPLQLAARKLLRDPLFSFDLKTKVPDSILASSKPVDLPTPSTTPNPATIAAAAAAASSSSTRATPASWNAKKTSSIAKSEVLNSSTSSLVAQPLSAYAAWELEHRSTMRRKYPHVTSSELDRKLLSLWKRLSDVEREKYGILALRAQRMYAEGLARDLGTPTAPQPTSSDEESW